MPLYSLQSDILRTLAGHRNPENYVAGSTPLHRDGLDLLYIHEQLLPPGAVIRAAVGKTLRARCRPGRLLFLENAKPVQPDPKTLNTYTKLAGRRQGLWPGSSEIGHGMLERYGKPRL